MAKKSPLNEEMLSKLVNPGFTSSTGKQMADKLGLKYDFSEIVKIFEDAARDGNKVTKEMYDQAANKYYENIGAQSAEYLNSMRKANAEAANTGASRGVAAANELSALLGMTQQGAAGALDLALQGNLLGDQMGAALSQAQKDALSNFNSLGATLGELLNNAEAVDAQKMAVIAELMAQGFTFDGDGNLVPPAEGAGGGGGYGGGRGTGGGTGAGGAGNGIEGAIMPENGGRYTDNILSYVKEQNEPFANSDMLVTYTRALDQIDRYGKASEATIAALKKYQQENGAAFTAMVKSIDPLAERIAVETKLTEANDGSYVPVPPEKQQDLMARGDSNIYEQLPTGVEGPLQMKPGATLPKPSFALSGPGGYKDSYYGSFANAKRPQSPTDFLPAGVVSDNPLRNAAVDRRLLAEEFADMEAASKQNWMERLFGGANGTKLPNGDLAVLDPDGLLEDEEDNDKKTRLKNLFKKNKQQVIRPDGTIYDSDVQLKYGKDIAAAAQGRPKYPSIASGINAVPAFSQSRPKQPAKPTYSQMYPALANPKKPYTPSYGVPPKPAYPTYDRDSSSSGSSSKPFIGPSQDYNAKPPKLTYDKPYQKPSTSGGSNKPFIGPSQDYTAKPPKFTYDKPSYSLSGKSMNAPYTGKSSLGPQAPSLSSGSYKYPSSSRSDDDDAPRRTEISISSGGSKKQQSDERKLHDNIGGSKSNTSSKPSWSLSNSSASKPKKSSAKKMKGLFE